MFNFIPDTERLTQIFSQAIAPTFFLGAVAAFISLMASRLSAVIVRVQTLNAITEDDLCLPKTSSSGFADEAFHLGKEAYIYGYSLISVEMSESHHQR
jgi:hypothetical protein